MAFAFEWDLAKATANLNRGRLLAVMHTERRRSGEDADAIRIISAREATRGERTAYEEGIR